MKRSLVYSSRTMWEHPVKQSLHSADDLNSVVDSAGHNKAQ